MSMSEWKEYRLGDVGKIVTGKTPKTAITDNYGGNIPFLSPSDNMELKYVPITARHLTEKGLAEVKSCLIPENSVCVSCIGSDMGKSVITVRPIVTNQQINSIIPSSNFDTNFLYYILQNKKREIKFLGRNGTAVPILNKSAFSNLTILAPELDEQRSIASILSSLDSKIENNRKICANLEAQAQALFKHWFIDFAPFKDGKFVESELGMIPEGWRVGTYNDIIQETISGDWGKESLDGNYVHKVACIRGCDFQDVKMGLRGKTPERYILEKNFQSKHFEDKDVLVEISGGTATVSTGRICPISQLLIDKYNGDIICTNFCRLVRPHKGYSSYLYYSWKYKYDKKVMFGYENGTSGIKNFSIKDFTTREPLVLPTLTALNEFEGMIEHIHTQIQNCGSESSKLAVIRDTLLPKLMSGEIKV